jgi:excisionase family DNA binding protein
MTDHPDIMSTGQAAKFANVSTATVVRACDDGLIEYFTTPGGHRRIKLTEVRRLMAHRTGAYRDYLS